MNESSQLLYNSRSEPTQNKNNKSASMSETTGLKVLCFINVLLLAACCGMIYFTVYWIVGCVCLAVGSVIDLIILGGRSSGSSYSLCWHIFMAISVGLCSAGLGYWAHDICVQSKAGGIFQEELEQQCIFSATTTICGFLITVLEVVIIIVGRMARIPACCCNQTVHPSTQPVVIQVPASQAQIYDTSVQAVDQQTKCHV